MTAERIVHPGNFECFMEVYSEALVKCVSDFPEDYPWYKEGLPIQTVVERMRVALNSGSYNHDGRAFSATCKKLGIRHTRRAIEQFITTP